MSKTKSKYQHVSNAMYTLGCKQKWSKYNQEYYYDLELISEHNGELYHTYISENNVNYDNWEPVIEAIQDNSHVTVLLTGTFRAKISDSRLINADSKFEIEGVFDSNEMLQGVYHTFYA